MAPVVWEEVACPLCHAQDEEPLVSLRSGADDYRVLRCRRCRMAYLNPRPTEGTIGHFYSQDYHCYQPPAAAGQAGLRQRLRHLKLAQRCGLPMPVSGLGLRLLAALSRWSLHGEDSLTAIPWVGQGQLLDYGCGSGWFAYRMQQLGWHVTAMDFSEHAVQQVKQHFQIPAFAGTLPHPRIAPASFDVITLGAVLEHVHDPHRLIQAAVEALRPGGLLVAAVPNIQGWGFRLLGQHWYGLHLPQHLLHFSPSTLRQLLERHGLAVQSIRTIGKASWLRRSAQAAQRQGASGLTSLFGWRPIASLASSLSAWLDRGDNLFAFARKSA